MNDLFSAGNTKKTFIEKNPLLQGIYLNWNTGLAWGASQAQCVLPGAVKCAKKKQVYPLKQLLLFTFQKTPKALKLPFIFAFASSFSAALIKKWPAGHIHLNFFVHLTSSFFFFRKLMLHTSHWTYIYIFFVCEDPALLCFRHAARLHFYHLMRWKCNIT